MAATLYIVGVPIGNQEDISRRAIATLQSVDVIACEELKEAHRFLRLHGIEKALIEINEHTEQENVQEAIDHLLAGRSIALISDAGMPLIADPGWHLVTQVQDMNIPVTTIPGPTSIMSALALSGFDCKRFFFYGFLSPKRDERSKELSSLAYQPHVLVFLDAPYRMLPVLEDMMRAFGKGRRACVACDLTLPKEDVRRGTLRELVEHFTRHKKKCEFVIVVEGR